MKSVRFGSYVARKDRKAGSRGSDLPLLSVSQYRGVVRFSELHDKPPRAEDFSDYKVAEANDIVFNKMSIRSGALGVADERGVVTYHYEVLEPAKGTVPEFVSYLMRSAWFTSELIKRERGIGAGGAAGVRTTEVPFTVLKTVPVPSFSVGDQARIVDYLDRETNEINAFIADLELAAELISARFDGKLATTFMQVPTWVPLRRLATLSTGSTPSSSGGEDTFNSDGVEWIRPGDIRNDMRLSRGSRKLSLAGAAEVKVHTAPAVLVVGIGATVGRVGQTDGPFATNQQITAVTPKAVDTTYLYFALRSLSTYIRKTANGNTLPIVNNSQLGTLEVLA